MLKKPSDRAKPERKIATEDEAEALARQLADKPYGDEHRSENTTVTEKPEKLTRTTISLPEQLLRECEDLALKNKRSGIEPKSFSALTRMALDMYLNSIK